MLCFFPYLWYLVHDSRSASSSNQVCKFCSAFLRPAKPLTRICDASTSFILCCVVWGYLWFHYVMRFWVLCSSLCIRMRKLLIWIMIASNCNLTIHILFRVLTSEILYLSNPFPQRKLYKICLQMTVIQRGHHIKCNILLHFVADYEHMGVNSCHPGNTQRRISI
jgi:hypothetical protein